MKQKKPHPKVQRIMDKAAKRRTFMRAYREAGYSYADIGKQYGISWQRVQQILSKE